jgi:hypothetical protein
MKIKDEGLTPGDLKRVTKLFAEFAQKHPYKRVTINHDNNPDRIEALKWFMSYDEVEKGQLIRLLYEMWNENQQVILQQETGER